MQITISGVSKSKSQLEEPLDTRTGDQGELTPGDHPRIPKLQSYKIDLNTKINGSAFEPNQKYICHKDLLRFMEAGRKYNMSIKTFKHDKCPFNTKPRKEYNACMYYCVISIGIALIFGLLIALFLTVPDENAMIYLMARPETMTRPEEPTNSSQGTLRTLNSINEMATRNDLAPVSNQEENKGKFSTVSFTGGQKKHGEVHSILNNREIYPKGMTEDMKDILKDNKHNRRHDVKILLKENKTDSLTDNTIIYDNVYWGPRIEHSLPQGYEETSSDNWEDYVKQSEVVKMENGCGRMQNRLVTFRDGRQACVRYRQNTDQIQGEIFSFYVARLLNLTNLAPSVISVVDLNDRLWQNVASEIATAQWNTNRPVVLTQYIPGLESAPIPEAFKPSERHLNKFDILKMSLKENDNDVKNVLIEKLRKYQATAKSGSKDNAQYYDHIEMNIGEKTVKSFVELAQWSELIIFDYLTANLDRIVNNLFNFQWNINIMDGPAHNLARKADSGLLMFLDNESGLLHGYRLLKKYNVYHSLMLDNLCVFRRSTIDALKALYEEQSVGSKIQEMFRKKNNAVIRDILPPLPEKNIKILFERIGKVLSQVQKCEQSYSKR